MNSDLFLHILLIILPAGGIFLTVVLFLKKQGEKEVRHLQIELRKERQNFFLPSRVESYQRAVLLMERINPNSLVMRLHTPGLPAKVFQADLLKAIRDEFDHNVAQQIFISIPAWKMVKSSKEETIKIINLAGNQMESVATSTELAGKIFEIVNEIGNTPTDITVEYLKKELQELF
jgi:hypothetical protein